MPSKSETIQRATQLFDLMISNDLSKAWLGIYQVLMWFERVSYAGYTDLPHIIDADKLRPSVSRRKKRAQQPTVWQKRAETIQIYLSDHLNCTTEEAKKKVDLLMKHRDFKGLQRHNPLGTAFAGLTRHILQKFSNSSLSYDLEVNANDIFPGITFPGRSTTPAMDIYVSDSQGQPKAIVSVKWSVRHDRINDLTNECPVYKAAAQRQSRIKLSYYVVTNEFDPARLSKLLQDTCFDAVVHVHKPAVTEVCGLDGRLANLKDLTDFVRML